MTITRGLLASLALTGLFATPAPCAAASPTPVAALIEEALHHNPELAAARQRASAAAQRVRPASALEDPMLEFGVVNAPLAPFSLRREEMTMQMVGLSQRVPFPGKRPLRAAVARSSAAAAAATADDVRDQVVRELRTSYEELSAVRAEREVVAGIVATLREFIAVAEARYAVGSASQTDVLQAETQLARARQQLLELDRREAESQAMLSRLAGRAEPTPVEPVPQRLTEQAPVLAALIADSARRPRAVALEAERASAEDQVALMQREFYPDVDVKLTYGQRQRAPDGMPRDDMISLTFGVNLPIWRRQRLEPQVAEARAMLAERDAMLVALRVETRAELAQRQAAADQSRRSVELFDQSLIPAADAAVQTALAAYRVGKVDFLTLLETRMRLFDAQMARVAAIAEHNRALADLDYLAGRLPDGVEAAR